MLYSLLTMSLILSITLMFLNHPMSMGFILFIQTLCLCFISGFMSLSFWFSYVLLLIYLGGMLILFMYITSLASNELFSYSNKILLIIFLVPLILSLIHYTSFYHQTNLYENMENSMNFIFMPNNFLLKMYNYPNNIITILIACYLFLALIAVVKMTNIFKGPLRQMN
uniref:NADH dehydrogenase subunit 6 n=1 Tax=Deroplatys truncata TaxID=627735 RepID=UPI0022FD43D9|nr:NADH dehydrogenase subunit 6 [Deroplatys truncata]UIX55362.1 NADH dehydrogenase subunit 6 [Deroplatys truncata]